MKIRVPRPLILLLLTIGLIPASAFNTQASSLDAIQAKISQYLRRPGVRSAQWGIQVLDPSTNEVLVEVNPDKVFLPASVMKVITTSAALEKLGPDFKYRTGIYTDGTLDPSGLLTGDVIIVGRGDPNLFDSDGELLEKPALVELVEQLRTWGIKRIQGDIIGDDGYFEKRNFGKGWITTDISSAHGAPINALSINNNVLWIQANPTRYKQRVSISVEPHTSYFNIRNQAVTGSVRSRRSLAIRLIPGTKTIVVSGRLPANRSYGQYVLLKNPTEVVATILKEELQRQGVAVQGEVRVAHSGDYPKEERSRWNLLAEHQSPPLIRAVEIINKQSQNLHAEMLLRTLGAELKNEGSNEAGINAVKDFLVEAGIDDHKVQLNDGCGLSRENLVTPRFQTSLLQYLSTRPYFELFWNTLAISGTDGTLRHRLYSQEVRGSIHAKTGTLNGVSSLAGFMTTRSGRNLVFSIFANRVRASARVKKTIDEICSLFVNLY